MVNRLCCVLQEALDRQSRPTAEELGLSMDPFTDSMSDLETLGLRLEYVAAMMQGVSFSSCGRSPMLMPMFHYRS
jgi:hypothetical protein